MNRRPTTSLRLETLEARDVPAFFTSLVNGQLRLVFDNNAATAQSVQISSVNGYVTLNERRINVRADAVRAISVVGSDLDNFIDLKFVSTGTGFHGLNGRVNLVGKGGNDVILGTQFGDRIDGGAGNDQISGCAGNDTLLGGYGDDWIYAGPGNDVLDGGPGNDWFDRLEPGDRLLRH